MRAEARELGIIHHLVPADEVLPRSLEIARALADKPPMAMGLIKRRLWEVLEPGFDDAMDAAIRYHAEALASGEATAESRRFLASRKKSARESKS